METSTFRALAPATKTRSPPPEPDLNLKRKRTAVACDTCRIKRTGCDGVRPVCAACRKMQSHCIYMNQEDQEMRPTVLKRQNTALREKVAAFGDTISHLLLMLYEGMPKTTVQDTLQRLEAGSDPAVVLKTLRSQNLEATPSAQSMARATLPQVQSACEFELHITHPSAFPLVDLSQCALTTGNTLVTPTEPSTLDGPRSRSPPFMSFQHDELTTHLAGAFSLLEDLSGSESSTSSAYTPMPQYFDPRLALLKIGLWTTVPISNAQAAGAISLYLEIQHHVWGVFDAGLFVSDLIEFKFDYCSPFMVSSLLAIASLCYAPLDPELSKYSYAFEKEAEKLFQSERKIDSLPTLAGLALLYGSLAVHGEGLRALKFLTAASQAAERSKLFGVPEALKTLNSASHETLVATSATAWGLFNLMVNGVRFYLLPPISYPPNLPMPAELSRNQIPERKATRESVASREKLVELDVVLSKFSELWIILNQTYLIYRDQENSAGSMAFALSKYSRLLQLVDDLPQTMIRRRQTANHVLIFQRGLSRIQAEDISMTVHLAILDIFRPFVAPKQQHKFRSNLPQGTSPTSTFAASVKQLKSLIFEYTNQHPLTHYNQLFSASITYAANAVLNDRLDPEQRSYFFFYIHVGRRIGSMSGGRAVNGTMQALLAIAHDKGVITSAEAIQFIELFRNEDYAQEDERAKMESGWAADLDLAISDTAAANVDLLASRFEEITLFNEFTEGLT